MHILLVPCRFPALAPGSFLFAASASKLAWASCSVCFTASCIIYASFVMVASTISSKFFLGAHVSCSQSVCAAAASLGPQSGGSSSSLPLPKRLPGLCALTSEALHPMAIYGFVASLFTSACAVPAPADFAVSCCGCTASPPFSPMSQPALCRCVIFQLLLYGVDLLEDVCGLVALNRLALRRLCFLILHIPKHRCSTEAASDRVQGGRLLHGQPAQQPMHDFWM